MSNKTVRIGGASGAWGDSPMAIGQLLTEPVDYLMMDYLAEVTMSLLARARLKNPDAGFPPDFVGYLKPHLASIAERGIKVASNGGGVNPQAAKRALEAACTEAGLSLRIAVVEGDDLMPHLDTLGRDSLRDAESGDPLPSTLLTANAYLGALPIAAAFDAGADIVITGRCADSSLALGILMHEFGWAANDYDKLAAGSLVGHILECGPQATGGVFTDWQSVPGWDNIGYPLAECSADGSFVVSKPANTGGMVTTATIGEQVLYEVGDPAAYLLPDVTADFSHVKLEQVGENQVRLTGARGLPPTKQYKVSATWADGWRAVPMVAIVGYDAVAKAERTAEALLARARRHFAERGLADFSRTHVEVLGAESSYGSQSRTRDSREVVLRVVAEHEDAKALDLMAREVGSIGLSFAQGTAGLIGGRPKPTPLIRLFTFFVDKAALPSPTFTLADNAPQEVPVPVDGGFDPAQVSRAEPAGRSASDQVETAVVPLRRVAHGRSGDKGNSSNIAIVCRRPEYFDWLCAELTAERIADWFGEWAEGGTTRYLAPGLPALNFLIHGALAGGGMASPRIDPQGKAFAQRALEMPIAVPRAWLRELPEQ